MVDRVNTFSSSFSCESQEFESIEACENGVEASSRLRAGGFARNSPRDCLTGDMITLRRAFTEASKKNLALLELRLEAVRRLESEARTLREENHHLRRRIAKDHGITEMAGTGESYATFKDE